MEIRKYHRSGFYHPKSQVLTIYQHTSAFFSSLGTYTGTQKFSSFSRESHCNTCIDTAFELITTSYLSQVKMRW